MIDNVRATTEQILLHQYRRRKLAEVAELAKRQDTKERLTIEVVAWILFGILVTFIAILLAGCASRVTFTKDQCTVEVRHLYSEQHTHYTCTKVEVEPLRGSGVSP